MKGKDTLCICATSGNRSPSSDPTMIEVWHHAGNSACHTPTIREIESHLLKDLGSSLTAVTHYSFPWEKRIDRVGKGPGNPWPSLGMQLIEMKIDREMIGKKRQTVVYSI